MKYQKLKFKTKIIKLSSDRKHEIDQANVQLIHTCDYFRKAPLRFRKKTNFPFKIHEKELSH